METIAVLIGIGLLYYWNNREASKPLKYHEELANAALDKNEYQGVKRQELLLKLQQNLNAAHTQRAVRNIEVMVLLLLVMFIMDRTGWAFWN